MTRSTTGVNGVKMKYISNLRKKSVQLSDQNKQISFVIKALRKKKKTGVVNMVEFYSGSGFQIKRSICSTKIRVI